MPIRIRTAGLAVSLAIVLACTDTVSPRASAVTGLWDFTGTWYDLFGTSCADTGSFALVQRGDSAAGTVEFVRWCWSAAAPAPSLAGHAIDSLHGRVVGNTFILATFSPTGGGTICSDTVVVATGVRQLTGAGYCSGAGTVAFFGTPGGPVTSISVTPVSAQRIIGGSVTVEALMKTAASARVYGRPIAWASDKPAVASVSASSLPSLATVTGTGPGTAIISATSGGVSASATITVPSAVAFTAVGGGNARTCALDPVGTPFCWGTGSGAFPSGVAGGVRFTQLSVGYDFSCGLTATGAASCWGANGSGQLGIGSVGAGGINDAPAPVPVQTTLTFTSISAGGYHACALTAAGAAWCWGSNDSGRLGNGSTTRSTVPVAVSGGVAFQSLSAGGRHTCGVATSGTLYCWGDNSVGQVGDSTAVARRAPVAVKGGLTFTRVSAGGLTTCGIAIGGAAYCWGSGLAFFLPPGLPIPTLVGGGHTFTAIATGLSHACALDTAAAIWCWGVNYFGQLGNGGTTASATPVAVTGGLSFATVTVGVYEYSDEATNGAIAGQSCGVTTGVTTGGTTGGTTWCWGVNNIGQLGSGVTGFGAVSLPLKVKGQP